MTEARRKLKYRVQMPPFMSPRKPVDDVLVEDPDLEGLNDCKYVFTDISFDASLRVSFVFFFYVFLY